jgi:hypothetical protein
MPFTRRGRGQRHRCQRTVCGDRAHRWVGAQVRDDRCAAARVLDQLLASGDVDAGLRAERGYPYCLSAGTAGKAARAFANQSDAAAAGFHSLFVDDRGIADRIDRGGGEQGLEGTVAKRRASLYEPGKRSGEWQKMRVHQRGTLVIGGHTLAGRMAAHQSPRTTKLYDRTSDQVSVEEIERIEI